MINKIFTVFLTLCFCIFNAYADILVAPSESFDLPSQNIEPKPILDRNKDKQPNEDANLLVEKSIVKRSPVSTQPLRKRQKLPGVNTITLDTLNNIPYQVVTIGNDETKIITLSKMFPNRISTPFSAPRVIDSSNIDMRQDGSSIYVSPKESNPFAIYVTGSDPGDQVISLTIIPKDIPSQTIVLQSNAASNVGRVQKNESYTQKIINLLRQVALGQVPEGYAEGKLPNVAGLNAEILIVPKKRYSGSWLDIYSYLIMNKGEKDVKLSETSFYRKGVKAVSIFPNLKLSPNETTMVYVIADKTAVVDGGFNVSSK
jgi:conjugal transfer pilus assembly protein TraK